MKKLIIIVMAVLLYSNTSFAGSVSCLVDLGVGPKTCAEQSSNQPGVHDLYRDGCDVNPYGVLVNTCPGKYGCKIKIQAGDYSYTTIAWYDNGETRELVQQVCGMTNGTLVTK